MKIAFAGKGGSGKTTLTSLFARHLADAGLPVLAIDADINQHLGVALGLDEDDAAAIPAMGDHLDKLKEHLRGANPRIRSAASMVKTTPAGTGSRLLPLTQPTPADRHQPTAPLHVVFAPAAGCERARAGIRPASSAVGCRARRWTEA